MKRLFVLLLCTLMITTGCTGDCSTSAYYTMQAGYSTDAAPASTVHASVFLSSAAVAPSPSPQACVELIRASDDDPGLTIGCYAVSDNAAIYYLKDNTIFKIDKKTKAETKLLDTDYRISCMFLDTDGILFYYGRRNNSDDIVRFNGKTQKVIIRDIYGLEKVSQEYIYFTKNLHFDDLILRRYNFSSGVIDNCDIKNNQILSRVQLFQTRSLCFLQFKLDMEPWISSYYLMDYRTDNIVETFDSGKFCIFSDDEKCMMVLDSVDEYSKPVKLVGFSDTLHDAVVSLPINMDSTVLYSINNFILDGMTLQLIYNNYIYIIDTTSSKLMDKICIYQYDEADTWGYDSQAFFFSNKWYILVQKPLKEVDNSCDSTLVEVQPSIYSYDIATHSLKCIWKADSYKNEGGARLSIDINSGYIWLYNDFGDSKVWKRIALEEVG